MGGVTPQNEAQVTVKSPVISADPLGVQDRGECTLAKGGGSRGCCFSWIEQLGVSFLIVIV